MKKFILLILMAVMTLGAAAQVRTSRTFTRSKSNTMWYLRAGMNISTPGKIEVDDDEFISPDGTVGFDVDFGFHKPFGESNLYWGMELGFGSRGAKVKFDDYGNTYEAKTTGYGITYSPFTFGYKYPLTENIKLDGHLGGFLEYDFAFGGDGEFDNKFDGGLQVGVGAWFNRFNLDVTYQAGFVNTASGYTGDCCKIGKVMIRVGYAF